MTFIQYSSRYAVTDVSPSHGLVAILCPPLHDDAPTPRGVARPTRSRIVLPQIPSLECRLHAVLLLFFSTFTTFFPTHPQIADAAAAVSAPLFRLRHVTPYVQDDENQGYTHTHTKTWGWDMAHKLRIHHERQSGSGVKTSRRGTLEAACSLSLSSTPCPNINDDTIEVDFEPLQRVYRDARTLATICRDLAQNSFAMLARAASLCRYLERSTLLFCAI